MTFELLHYTIITEKLQRDVDSVGDAFSDLASVISTIGTGLRRPKISGLSSKKKKGRSSEISSLTDLHNYSIISLHVVLLDFGFQIQTDKLILNWQN